MLFYTAYLNGMDCRLITDVAQDGVFLEIALHSDNVITLPLHLCAHYFRNDKAIPTTLTVFLINVYAHFIFFLSILISNKSAQI
jgi:hypothetical protein